MLPYMSLDVATEPSTPVFIIPVNGEPPAINIGKETVFAITEDCVEPTDGWIHREGKPLLTVCFMHSFGKCTGRKNYNPRTCSQIHLNPIVLNSLRKQYSNPTRKFFTRTVRARIGPELRQQLSSLARKTLKVQYLEYRVQDVQTTLGFLRYEAAFKEWLFSDSCSKKDAPHTLGTEQCSLFAQTQSCPSGKNCPFIHASPHKATVRDRVLAKVLRLFPRTTQGTCETSRQESKARDYSDLSPKEFTSDPLGLVFVFSEEEKKVQDFNWDDCAFPSCEILPVPDYTVEQNELSITARLIPYTWEETEGIATKSTTS